MTWYKVSVNTSAPILIMFLISAVLQILLSMRAREWIREKSAGLLFGLFYIVLSLLSIGITAELIIAAGSIDIGAFIQVRVSMGYLSVLPPLLYVLTVTMQKKIPEMLRPPTVSYFIPLLLLPQSGYLPMPLPVLTGAFAAAWFIADASRMLLLGRKHEQSDVTLDALRHVVHSFDYGICIADHRGVIVEKNRAFESLWQKMGLSKLDSKEDVEADLQNLYFTGVLSITDAENGQLIKRGENTFFLGREYFKACKKTYLQYFISDITHLYKKIMALEDENKQLEVKNTELENAMSGIALEASFKQREKLNRSVHDVWSNKLAVAGLSADILLRQKDNTAAACDLTGFIEVTGTLAQEESIPKAEGLREFLSIMTDTYENLGVKIKTSGKAGFSTSRQEVLCHVLREGLANAVRHAYTMQIDVVFEENEDTASMIIINSCLDSEDYVSEGRGLHDIRNRVQEAGGKLEYIKNKNFCLKVIFPGGQKL